MAFDPSLPAHGSPILSAELRDQFNALAALIEELRTRLDCLPGMGTDVFIKAAGNDATAAVGDPARPFRTAQAAFDAAAALPGDRVLRFGAGDFGGITLAADWPERISLAGAGATVSRLGGITATGAPGPNGANETGGTPAGPGGKGGNGFAVRVATDRAIDLGNITTQGGPGGSCGQNLDGTYTPLRDGVGGNGGAVELTGCTARDVIASAGSNGPLDNDNSSGAGATVTLLDCSVRAVESRSLFPPSPMGQAGTVTLTRCLYTNVDVFPNGTFNDTPTAPDNGVSSNVAR